MTEVRVLLADSDPEARERIKRGLTEGGYAIETVGDARGIRDALTYRVPDIVLLGANLAGEATADLISEIHERYEHLPTIVMTSNPDPSLIVEGMKRGAHDFLSKPVDITRLEISLKNAVHLSRLMVKVNQLQSQYQRRGQFMDLVGVSPRMQTIYSIVENVGKTDVTVFITGPSGTGKELVAQAIHRVSDRATGRFVPVNCAAIPKDLMESELFGHERGAFTGASARYRGCCEQADGGTLFLDEICEMEFNLQSKLLRFLQERSFHRLGGKDDIRVNVRVLAATNRDPLDEVRTGQLREDLYYRLNVVPLQVPPLRERKEDIPLLANFFLERISSKHGKYFYDFAPEAMGAMLAYDWQGNVRELENSIERIVVLFNGSQVMENMLPDAVRERRGDQGPASSAVGIPLGDDAVILPMCDIERIAIERALSICRGNVAQAARRLQIGQATMYRKIKKFNLTPVRS